MPLFEYVCTDCTTSYDVLHKGRENEELIVCPSCGSRAYAKKLSTFATAASGTYSYADSSCASGSCGYSPSPSPCAGGACGLA